MNSIYAQLLQALQDETQGAGPPLPAVAPVKEPTPDVAASLGVTVPPPSPAGESTPVTGGFAPLPEPELEASPVVAPQVDPEEKITLEDVQPTPRAANQAILPSAISRAGSQLGAALAGVKADTSAGDRLYAEGAHQAQATDKSEDEYTNFKRQLMLKAGTVKRTPTGKKYNDSLANPNSNEWKTFDLAMRSTESTRGPWEKFVNDAKANGVTPDANFFEAKVSQGISGDTSRLNNQNSALAAERRQMTGQEFTREMEGIRANRIIDLKQLDEEIRLARDARDAFIPDRAFIDPNQPPNHMAAKAVRETDAHLRFVLPAIERLRGMIQEKGGWRAVPGFNGEVASLAMAVNAAMLSANGYGVPTGEDWNMILKELGDPTRWADLVTQNQDRAITEAAKHILEKSEAKARSMGFMPYSRGSGNAAKPMDPLFQKVRDGVNARTGKSPAAVRTPSPAPSGMVLMSNGKETLEVPAVDVADAELEGFKRVQ